MLVQCEIGRGFLRNEPPRSLQQLACQVILCTVQEFANNILYHLLPPLPHQNAFLMLVSQVLAVAEMGKRRARHSRVQGCETINHPSNTIPPPPPSPFLRWPIGFGEILVTAEESHTYACRCCRGKTPNQRNEW